mmetsp:Transcript_19459/g.51079  ORF Transcript_19459/g.51079 Transcript_19459/m.51079 type:complete len:433 (+) Transcript_19459:162-1460(+)
MPTLASKAVSHAARSALRSRAAAARSRAAAAARSGILSNSNQMGVGSDTALSDEQVVDLFDRYDDAVKQRRWPNRIILVRHGLSEGNLDASMFSTKPDALHGLAPLGFEQATETGANLRELIGDEPVQFITSSYKRTRQTLDCILEAFDRRMYSEILEDHRLREQEFGMFQDDAAEMSRRMEERVAIGSFYYRFPGGESAADVYDRVSSLVDHMAGPFGLFSDPRWSIGSSCAGHGHGPRPTNVVLVTHGLTARLFLMAWFNLTVDQFHGIWNLDNGGTYILEKTADGPTVEYKLREPLRAGGKYPPPRCAHFKHGRSTTEPSTWGVTSEECRSLWRRHSCARSHPTSRVEELSKHATFHYLQDLVDLAFPRLVDLGYMSGDEDTTDWAERLWKIYFGRRGIQERRLRWGDVPRIVHVEHGDLNHDVTSVRR